MTAHRTAPPYDLVVKDRLTGRLLMGQGGGGQSLAQQAEGPVSLSRRPFGLTFQSQSLRAEHRIVDAGHQGVVIAQLRRQRDIVGLKLLRGILQIHLIEDAVLVVACQERPVLGAVLTPLRLQASQVGLGGYLVGAHAWRHVPQHASAVLIGFVEHPPEHQSDIALIVNDGEDACRLQVSAPLDGSRVEASVGRPLCKRLADERSSRVGDAATEAVVVAVGAHCIPTLAHRHDVDALACLQLYLPRILWHAGDDMMVSQRPPLADATVLHPQVVVVGGDFHPRLRVLNEHGGVRLARTVNDAPLVVY